MPFCRHCGVEHTLDDRFCPSCGRPIAEPPPGGGRLDSPPNGSRRGVTDVLGHALGALWHLRTWRLAATAAVAVAVEGAVAVGALLVVAYAAFSTIDPHTILRTGCFQRNALQPGGAVIRSGCDPIRLRADAGALTAAAIPAVVIVIVVYVLTSLAVYRRCDRDAGNELPRSILPGPATCFRAVYRVLGWELVAVAAFVLLTLAVSIPLAVTGAATAGGARALLLLGEIAALAWLGIWWVVPFCVRVYLAGLRMVLDDLPLITAYRPISGLGRGQAWGFVGLSIVISIAVSITLGIISVPLGSVPAGPYVAQFVFTIISTLVTTAFAVAMMRHTAGELPPPAPRAPAAGQEYRAGGSTPGTGGSAA